MKMLVAVFIAMISITAQADHFNLGGSREIVQCSDWEGPFARDVESYLIVNGSIRQESRTDSSGCAHFTVPSNARGDVQLQVRYRRGGYRTSTYSTGTRPVRVAQRPVVRQTVVRRTVNSGAGASVGAQSRSRAGEGVNTHTVTRDVNRFLAGLSHGFGFFPVNNRTRNLEGFARAVDRERNQLTWSVHDIRDSELPDIDSRGANPVRRRR